MHKNLKKISYWGGTILLGVIAAGIYDKVKEVPIFTTLKNVFSWVWYEVFCAEFKLWQILLFLILLIFILYVVTKKKHPEPAFKSYTSDKIDGYNWTWRWVFNNNQNSWTTDDITPDCPKCETRMHYNYIHEGAYRADCPRCGYSRPELKPLKDIDAVIIDNCRKRGI